MTEGNVWNVMVAKGEMTADDPNKPNYHSYSAAPNEGNAILAADPVTIYPGSELVTIGVEKGKASISLVKVHAVMMYLAWGVLAPIG